MMTIYVILDAKNRVRGFPYVARAMAIEALQEANKTWEQHGPHRVVRFVSVAE